MGVMDKFLNYMKLNGEDDEYYDEDYLDDEEEVTPASAPRKSGAAKNKDAEEEYAEHSSRKAAPVNKGQMWEQEWRYV